MAAKIRIFQSHRIVLPVCNTSCYDDSVTTISIRETGICIRETGICIRETGMCIRETGICIRETGICIRETGICIRTPSNQMHSNRDMTNTFVTGMTPVCG